MGKTVQILLLAALLLPMVGAAREETLEERKKRITRKYLRERVNVTQGDMYVPSDLPPEDERVLESEQFKQTEDALTRERPATPMPPPPQRRPIPQQQETHWLLEGLDDEGRDPYADPFARDKPKEAETDIWTPMERNEDSRYGTDRKRNPYERYDPYASRNRYGSSRYGNDTTTRQSPYANRYGVQGNADQTDRYGRSTDSARGPGSTLYTPRSYGVAPDTGLLASPFTQTETPSGTDTYRRPGTPRETPGYKPHTSPYQARQQQRNQSTYGDRNRPQQEYKKPDAYQQWKKRNDAWDPTRDDAYIDELMRQNRR